MIDSILQFAHKMYEDVHHNSHIYTYYSRTLCRTGYIVDRKMNTKAVLKCMITKGTYESVFMDFVTSEILCENEKIGDFNVEMPSCLTIKPLDGYFIPNW